MHKNYVENMLTTHNMTWMHAKYQLTPTDLYDPYAFCMTIWMDEIFD